MAHRTTHRIGPQIRPNVTAACSGGSDVVRLPHAHLPPRLIAREILYGAWSVIPSALSVRLLAAAGLDYVVIDLQHGGATESDLPGMTSAIRLAGAAPVARVRYAHPADIGRALDLGCEGVIVPNVDSAAQAATLAVNGVDGIYVGPRDLSLALGCAPDPDDPVLNPARARR
jgi:2-keto-3-deoxy-L-rhamnonate aldolase RhmA